MLDLVLTDVFGAEAAVSPGIADHSIVTTFLRSEVAIDPAVPRSVWQFHRADWGGLRSAYRAIDWRALLAATASEAAESVTKCILELADQFVPKTLLLNRSCSHPWLNDGCKLAIRRKCDAYGLRIKPVSPKGRALKGHGKR